MPSFNAYPLAAVTAVGEYLMALPQQLEVLMGQSTAATAGAGGSSGGDGDQQQQQPAVQEDEGDELAAEWLDKVRPYLWVVVWFFPRVFFGVFRVRRQLHASPPPPHTQTYTFT